MSELDSLRGQIRERTSTGRQGGNRFFVSALAFPVLCLIAGLGWNYVQTGEVGFGRSITAMGYRVDDPTGGHETLAENKAFLAAANMTADDPFLVATEQLRTYSQTIAGLRYCERNYNEEKYRRLRESYERRNRPRYDAAAAILKHETLETASEFTDFQDDIIAGNPLEQTRALVGARGMAMQNAAKFSGLTTLQDNRKPISFDGAQCAALSRDVTLGKHNLKPIKK